MFNRSQIIKFLVIFTLYAVTSALIASVFVWAPHERNTYPLLRAFIIVFASVLLTKYFIYMALSPWNDVVSRLRKRTSIARGVLPYRPRVSVIMPAWNEEIGLLNAVRSVVRTSYPDVELIVINDGSTDDSDNLMRRFLKKYSKDQRTDTPHVPIIYRYKDNGGKGRALNDGVALATGEIILSIDADCLLEKDTIGHFVECFEDEKVMAAVGNVKIGGTATLLGTVQHLEFLFSFYFKKADSLLNTIYIIGGAAGAFRKSVFESIGTYSSKNITEDIDFSMRIQEAGMRIVYAENAVIYTEGASTLRGLMAQRLRWKLGRFQTFWEHRQLFFSAKSRTNSIACLWRRISSHTGCKLESCTTVTLVSIAVYLCALPFVFFAGLGLFILFFASAYLLSREYFELAAMRFRPVAEAKAFRKAHHTAVFTSGLLIAAFVSIPIVNLATPLFAMAFMVHMHKKLSQRALIEVRR